MTPNQGQLSIVKSTDEKYSSNIFLIHEEHAGRLVLDPSEARREFGDEIADKLKLSKDGKFILWPQPTDDPEDPQNWSDRRKNIQLFIIILASLTSNFETAIGIPTVFALAKEFHQSSGEINDMVQNWSIFLEGWGGLFFVPFVRRYGRLGTLFWTQLLALGFLVGATFAPNLRIFQAMRLLLAFFGTCPQATGLFTIMDLFPFHLQARKINLWTVGLVLAPHLSPFLFGFLVARASWRWAFGIGCIYALVVFILIVLFVEESFYIRTTPDFTGPINPKLEGGFYYRLQTLLGVTGYRSARMYPTWIDLILSPFKLVWRPHLLLILIFEAVIFSFGIGINVTNTVFLQSPPPFGFGLSSTIVSGIYATPVIAVVLGLFIGRYLNDWIMTWEVRRNNGVFEAEARLWTCYVGVFIYVVGLVTLGVALQNHLNLAAVIIGWGLAQMAVLIITVAVYAYCSDCFPREQGDISALLNLTRTLGGFAIAFFQVPWAKKHGALQVIGCEAAIVVASFILIVPFLQWRGRYLRSKFSTTSPKEI